MRRKAPQRIEPQSIEPMSSLSLHEKNVRELQELAQEAPAAPQRDRRKPLSRAARLHLIDMLSRQSATGLALVAGVSVYLAITAGRAFPARAAAWGGDDPLRLMGMPALAQPVSFRRRNNIASFQMARVLYVLPQRPRGYSGERADPVDARRRGRSR